MNKTDEERLGNLMAHYGKPMNQSMRKLLEERRRHEDGLLPVPAWRKKLQERGRAIEWEGAFFCRVISELLTKRKLCLPKPR